MKKVILLLFILINSGCNLDDGADGRRAEDINGKRLLTASENDKEQEAELTRYEESVNENPNFPNTTSSHPPVANDSEKIKEIIEVRTPYRLGNVVINGRDAWVTVHTGKNENKEQRRHIREEVTEVLFEGLPRLHFHVNVTQ